jgi:diguanylate cyclase (GGDEF)-like protein/PAS domain S-box-containing protein
MRVLDASKDQTVKYALELAGQVMFEYDQTEDIIHWADGQAVTAILGMPPEAVNTTDKILSILQPEDTIVRENALKEAFRTGTSYTVEFRLKSQSGHWRWFEERGSWLNLDGRKKLIGMIRTIDEQKKREDELSYLASYDELTGQLNRQRVKELLKAHLETAEETTSPAAYIMVGIDNLAVINSDFGFDVADEVIVETSRRLKATLHTDDHMGRVAGTKFGIIISDTNERDIRTVCNALLACIRESIVSTQRGGIAVSVCAGATELTSSIDTADLAMAQAEAALDSAKQIGPSSWSTFTEKTEVISRRKQNTHMSDVILTALNERQIRLAYQPIVADLNEAQTKYECLIRMQHGDEEVPAPQFIPAAERLGLVHLLDRRVLELATQTLRQKPEVALNVNISWETVKDPVWADGYIAHLRANRDVADRITVELTETQVVDAVEASVEFVSEIKELGCHFAIDDFGAGYTSFRNLKALDIDVLKIDGSFVTDVSSSRENQFFVRTLLDLARNFGMKTVAEWVDNDADAMLLKGLGVDYLQGFYIGKPEQHPDWVKDEDQAEKLLKARSQAG